MRHKVAPYCDDSLLDFNLNRRCSRNSNSASGTASSSHASTRVLIWTLPLPASMNAFIVLRVRGLKRLLQPAFPYPPPLGMGAHVPPPGYFHPLYPPFGHYYAPLPLPGVKPAAAPDTHEPSVDDATAALPEKQQSSSTDGHDEADEAEPFSDVVPDKAQTDDVELAIAEHRFVTDGTEPHDQHLVAVVPAAAVESEPVAPQKITLLLVPRTGV